MSSAATATAPLVIGLDIGTTNIKAALVGLDGRVVRVARRHTPVRPEPDGGAIHPLADLVAAAESAIRACAEAAPPGRSIAAIGIAGMAEAGAPVDAAGRPLTEPIAWYDPRPAPEAAAIAREIGPESLFQLTGLRPEPKYSLAKLVWLMTTRPAIRSEARGWAGVPELVAAHLTGALGTNASLACRTMAFDLRRGDWDPDLLSLAGLEPAGMPPVLPLGEPVGRLGVEVAFRLGVDRGLPVAIAGHDHVVGAFGAGVVEPGQVLDSLGTAEAVLVTTAEPLLEERVRLAGSSVGAHVMPGRFYVIAGLATSGALVDWFTDTFLAGDHGAAERDQRHESFLRLLDGPVRRPTGIVVDPAWRGRTAPSPAPALRGSIAGLTIDHGLADLAWATLEGIACHVRWMLETLELLADRPIERVRLIGGGMENRHLVELKAAVGPWPFEAGASTESVAVGAALIGAVAAGYATPDEIAGLAHHGGTVEVEPELAGAYDRFYRERFLPAVATRTGQ